MLSKETEVIKSLYLKQNKPKKAKYLFSSSNNMEPSDFEIIVNEEGKVYKKIFNRPGGGGIKRIKLLGLDDDLLEGEWGSKL